MEQDVKILKTSNRSVVVYFSFFAFITPSPLQMKVSPRSFFAVFGEHMRH